MLRTVSGHHHATHPTTRANLSGGAVFTTARDTRSTLMLLSTATGNLAIRRTARHLGTINPGAVRTAAGALTHHVTSTFVSPFTNVLTTLTLISLCVSILTIPRPRHSPSAIVIVNAVLLMSNNVGFVRRTHDNGTTRTLGSLISGAYATLHSNKHVRVPFSRLIPNSMVHLSTNSVIPTSTHVVATHSLFIVRSTLANRDRTIRGAATTAIIRNTSNSTLPLSTYGGVIFANASIRGNTTVTLIITANSSACLNNVTGVLGKHNRGDTFSHNISDISVLLMHLVLIVTPTIFTVGTTAGNGIVRTLLFTADITINVAPRVLPIVIAADLSRNTGSLTHHRIVIGRLPTVRGLKTVSILYYSGANALARSYVILRHCLGASNGRGTHILHRTFLGDFFRANLGGLVSLTMVSHTSIAPSAITPSSVLNRDLHSHCAGISRIPFSFSHHHLDMIITSTRNGARVIAGNTTRRVLRVYSFIRVSNVTRPLASRGLTRVHGRVTKLGTRNLHMVTITRGAGPHYINRFNVTSRYSVILVNFLTFLSPPGTDTTNTITALRTGNITIGILANSGSHITTAIYRRVNVSTDGILLNSRVSTLSSTRLTRHTRGARLFTGLSPLRGTHLMHIVHRVLNRAINFVNSNVGSTTTVHTDSYNVSISSTISVTGRSTSVVLLRGSLNILRHNVVRNHHACNGLLGCLGAAIDSGFNGILSIAITDLFLPFLPVDTLRLMLLSLICRVIYVTLP